MDLAIMLIKALPALILIFFIWSLTLGAGLGLKRNIDRYIIGFAAVHAHFFLAYTRHCILGAFKDSCLYYCGNYDLGDGY